MIKRFFIAMLGTIAGFWISIFICIAIGIMILSSIVASSLLSAGSVSTPVGSNSILYIDLSGTIPERYQPMSVMDVIEGKDNIGQSFIDIVDAIRLASEDDKIVGIYIHAGGSECGISSREEIAEALREFKESGKWVIAYGDVLYQGDYVIASQADEVYVNPSGSVDIHGVYSRTPYFKGLLDKLNINLKIFRVGTYKSAVEPFMVTEMSEASREQTRAMVDTIWTYIRGEIAANREVPESRIDMWADSICSVWQPVEMADGQAITAAKYRREVEEILHQRCGIESDEDLSLVTPEDYLAAVRKPIADGKDHIAVLFATGDIVDSGDGGIVGATMVPEIVALADDESVIGLLLRVNSGGGSAFASEQIWEALEYFKSKGKPLYVSMGDFAASGGYYISCGADRIYADRTTLTGSIGVFGIVPDLSAVANNIGITFSDVKSNENAIFPSPYAMTARQDAAMQSSVDLIYEQFTTRVAQGRGISQDSVKVIAEGRVWTGGAALRIGLVDQIGSMHTALTDLCSKCDETRVIYYPQYEISTLDQLLRAMNTEVNVGNVHMSKEAMQAIRFLDYLSTMSHVQARMMPISIY